MCRLQSVAVCNFSTCWWVDNAYMPIDYLKDTTYHIRMYLFVFLQCKTAISAYAKTVHRFTHHCHVDNRYGGGATKNNTNS